MTWGEGKLSVPQDVEEGCRERGWRYRERLRVTRVWRRLLETSPASSGGSIFWVVGRHREEKGSRGLGSVLQETGIL